MSRWACRVVTHQISLKVVGLGVDWTVLCILLRLCVPSLGDSAPVLWREKSKVSVFEEGPVTTNNILIATFQCAIIFSSSNLYRACG